jgi:hypothetical protein
MMAYRLFLAALALGPAVLLSVVTFSAIGAQIGLGVGIMGGAYALMSALRPGRIAAHRQGPALLRSAVLRRPPKGLPSLAQQRFALAETLSAAVELRSEPDAPPSRATAVARILSRVLDSWKISDLGTLPHDLTVTLTLLERLLTADPSEAGRIAQMFQRPDVVLGLRDEIDRIGRLRTAHDLAFAAYQATRRLHGLHPAPRNLVQALTALSTTDADLWHSVVRAHDPSDPAQRDAALWCVSQPTCDRATLACYLARLPDGAQLQNAALDGDRAFVDRIRNLIRLCNSGTYTRQELSYAPPPHTAQRLAQELDALSAITGEPRYPDPQCVFQVMEGRAPRPRPAWDLRAGRVTRAPNRADYL